jgi:opacity protein-like surface antigen
MKRRLILVAGAAFAASLSAAAADSPGYYITGDVGASFLPDLHFDDATAGLKHEQYDADVAAGGALGYDMGNGFRLELDSLSQNDPLKGFSTGAATGHLSSTSLMLNGTYDLVQSWPITPYVGAGLGFENVGGEVNGMTGRAFKPAYQAEAGLRDDITDQVSLFTEYQFQQSESVRLSDPTGSAHQHFADNVVLAGLTYKFGQ